MSSPPGTGPASLIAAAAQRAVQTLALALDTAIVPVEIRKQFKPGDGFPFQPVLVLTVRKAGKGERLFGSSWQVPYEVTIALVLSGRLDFAGNLSGELGSELDWQTSLGSVLREPANWGLSFIMGAQVDYDPPIDPGFAEKGLDVQQVTAEVWALEDDPS